MDWYDSDYSITEAIFAYSKDVVVQWPIREEEPELSGDSLTVVLSTLNNNWSYVGNRSVDLVVQVKSDDDFEWGTVKVAIAYAGNLADNDTLTTAVEAGVDAWKDLWSDAGLELEARYTTIALGATLQALTNSTQLFEASEGLASEDELLMVIGDTIRENQKYWGYQGAFLVRWSTQNAVRW